MKFPRLIINILLLQLCAPLVICFVIKSALRKFQRYMMNALLFQLCNPMVVCFVVKMHLGSFQGI